MADKLTESTISCLRCGATLIYVGVERFHEGARWGFIGELGELLVRKSSFDLYACGDCGHVEFFLPGVGDELRGKPEKPPVRRSRDPFAPSRGAE